MSSTRPDRGFYLALGLCGFALWLLFEALALREYFRNDDWWFLSSALSPGFSWREAFFPVGTARVFAIRPLGEVGFMRFGHALFGYEAFGYYQLSLLAHLARGAAIFGLARRLGIAPPIAAAAALLTLSRIPTLQLVWVAVGFAYILAAACAAVGVFCFVRAVQEGRAAWYAAALASLAVGLATHEVCVTLPAVYAASSFALDRDRPGWARIRSAVLRTLSAALLVLAYLAVRLLVVAPLDAAPDGYQLNFDPAVVRHNVWVQAYLLMGSRVALWSLIAGSALGLAWLARSASGRSALQSRYLPIATIGLVWLAASLAPVVGLPMGALRRSVPIEAPVCLLVAGLLDLVVRELGPARRRVALAAVALLVVVSIPWRQLIVRLDQEAPRFARHFVEMVDRERDRFEPGVQVVLLYGHPDLADREDLRLFEVVTYGASILGATLPGTGARYAKQDLREAIEPGILARNSVYVLAEPGLGSFHIADDERVLRQLLIPGLQAGRPAVFKQAIAAVIELRGAEAGRLLADACRARTRAGYVRPSICRAQVIEVSRQLPSMSDELLEEISEEMQR